MTVIVTTGEWANRYIANWQKEMKVTLAGDGMNAADLLELLHIPEDEAGIISVNGTAVRLENVLRDGDIIALFPAIIGG